MYYQLYELCILINKKKKYHIRSTLLCNRSPKSHNTILLIIFHIELTVPYFSGESACEVRLLRAQSSFSTSSKGNLERVGYCSGEKLVGVMEDTHSDIIASSWCQNTLG